MKLPEGPDELVLLAVVKGVIEGPDSPVEDALVVEAGSGPTGEDDEFEQDEHPSEISVIDWHWGPFCR